MPAKLQIKNLLSALPDPALLVDRRLIVIAANDAMAESLGRSLESIPGSTLEELLPSPIGARRTVRLREVLETGRAMTFEDSRAERHFVNTLVPLRGPDDEISAIVGIAVDITARKVAEEQLRQIVTTCLEGVWQIDAESKTTFVNDQMARMLGYEVDEMLGRSMYDFLDERAKAVASRNVQRRQRGIAEHHEFRFTHKDGSDVWTILAASPLTQDDGSYAGAVALVTDVTERRALEHRVEEAQKLESLGLLAGGVAHDFNNLLVGILGNASLAVESLPEGSPAREHLDEIITAGRRAAELTDQMLTYAGRGRMVAEPVDLDGLIEEMARLLRAALPRDTRLQLRLSSPRLTVVGDATQLRQVVMNLITNAAEAIGDEPGTVVVSTRVERCDVERLAALPGGSLGTAAPGTFARVEVRDSGCGMDPRTLERIFDPFFTTKRTGRGLGLAAVLGILRAHHGGIEVESEPGGGTCMRVLIPLAHQEAPAPSKDDGEGEPAWRGEGVILIVDDEPHVRSVLARVVERLGFTARCCEDGREGLHELLERGDDVRVALVDVTMPGLKGTELLAELRKAGSAVPVVLISGDHVPAVDDPALSPVAYLHKPFGLHCVRRVIQDLVGGETDGTGP